MNLKQCVCVCMGLMLACSAVAATFSANGGGAGGSSSKVGGSSPDYATLADAAADFNGFSGGAKADYTFYIAGNLSETTATAFGNATNNHLVRIKPAAGLQPSITYKATVDNAGPSGNLIIGSKNPHISSSDWGLVATPGFTVDGSNTEGGSSRDLTITNSGQAFSYNRIVCIVGDSDRVVIKNCKVINTNSSGLAAVAAIAMSCKNTAVPDAWTVDNCLIQCSSAAQGHGINPTSSGTPTAGIAEEGWTISNCDIEARIRSIFLNHGMAGTITNNRIKQGTVGSSNGYATGAVMVNSGASQSGKTLTISNNQIYAQSDNYVTGSYGPTAISLVSMGTNHTVNITNNMVIAKLTQSVSGTTNSLCRGIYLSSYSGFNVNMSHNSVYIPANAAFTGCTSANAFGMGGLAGSPASLTMKNNIVAVKLSGAACIQCNAIAPSALGSDYNDLYAATGCYAMRDNAGTNKTLAQVQPGSDANSFALDPTATTGSKWAPAALTADLHFTPASAKPAGLPGVLPLASVTVDLDGESRSTYRVYAGADELPTQGLPVALSGLVVE